LTLYEPGYFSKAKLVFVTCAGIFSSLALADGTGNPDRGFRSFPQPLCIVPPLGYGRCPKSHAGHPSFSHHPNIRCYIVLLLTTLLRNSHDVITVWDVTPYSPFKVTRCFGGTCRLRPCACHLLSRWFHARPILRP
jgi:hypothetical protein